jgi:hypothetical protein
MDAFFLAFEDMRIQIIPWNRVASSSSGAQENHHFYGNRNFVTMFTRANRIMGRHEIIQSFGKEAHIESRYMEFEEGGGNIGWPCIPVVG